MNEAELKAACEPLAKSGDARAAATLEVLRKLDNARYVLANAIGNINLAVSLGVITPQEFASRGPKIEIAHRPTMGELAKDVAAAASQTEETPLEEQFKPKPISGNIVDAMMDIRNQKVAEILSPGLSPEEAAIQATRKANSLPPTTDPAVTQGGEGKSLDMRQKGSGI